MFLREYFRMLTVICGLMLVYYFTVNAWVERDASQPKQLSKRFIDIDRSEQWWNKLYDDQQWQSKDPERLLTKRAEILYQSFENLGPRRYRLKPLTILVPQRSISTGQPSSVIVIENPEGAEVQFDADVSIVSRETQSTSISSVHLDGPVNMRSMRLVDGLPVQTTFDARTSQLKIDGNRIWSPQEIELKFGNSVFLGRDFAFTTSSDVLGKKTEETTARGPFTGLDHLEIIYVNRVDIELPDGGILQKQAAERLAGIAAPTAHLLVQCKKSFHFDFQRMLASLNDRVVLQHWLPGFPTDQVQADRIDLQFSFHAKPAADAPQAQPTATEQKLQQPEMELDNGMLMLDRIEAFGKSNDNTADEARWVQINAPNFMSSCKTRWINLILNENAIELANQLPTETTIESSPVYLQRDELQVWSPKLIYKFTPAAQDTESSRAEHLGLLWAQGPGEANMATKDGDVWTANWANTLTMSPDGLEDLVTVEGAAQIRSRQQGRFTAEKFEVWLKAFPDSSTTSAPSTESPQDAKSKFLPTRLQAFKDVIVNSNKLRAQVAVLKLWFDHQVAPPQTIDGGLAAQSQSNSNSVVIQQPTTSVNNSAAPAQPSMLPASMPGSVSTNNAILANASVDRTTIPTAATKKPLFADATTVTGSTLEAKLVLVPDQDPIIEHLLLQGGVTMTKERVSDDLALPATVTGEQIELEGTEGDALVFHIYGQPARVLIGGGNVIGSSIHFDQHRQLLYMDQPGEMSIPPEMLAKSQKQVISDPRLVSSSLQAPPLMNPSQPLIDPNQGRWLETPRVVWNGQMTFDGQLAKLSQGVSIRGVWQSDPSTIWHLQSNSDEMYVEVSGSTFNQSANDEPAKVELVQLAGNVDIQAAQTDTNMVRQSIEHFKLPLLNIFPQQQNLRGAGPGSLLSRRFNRKTNSNASTASSSQNEFLQCVHLTYLGEMDGAYNESRVTFRQDVAAVLGPIADWTQSLDVDRINMPSAGQTKMETEQLSIYSTKDRPSIRELERRFPGSTKSAWELEALGNVIIDANSERGLMSLTANEGRYDALNEILRFNGVPTRPAQLRQLPSAAVPNGLQVDLLEGSFNLRTGEMQMSSTNINGSLPPRFQNGGGPQGNVPAPNGNPPAIQSPRDFDVFQRR